MSRTGRGHGARGRRSRLRVHAWLGALLLIPLTLVAVSGAGLSFAREIDRVFAPELWTVSPPDDTARAPANALAETVERSRPADRLLRRTMPRQPQDAALAIVADARDKRWQVFVDPYRKTVTGARPLVEDPQHWLGRFHRSFLLGPAGQWLVWLSSIGLLLLFLSGLVARVRIAERSAAPARGHRGLVMVVAWLWLICAATALLAAITGLALDGRTPPDRPTAAIQVKDVDAVCAGQQLDTIWWLGDGQANVRCQHSGSIGPFGVNYPRPSGEASGPATTDWLAAVHNGSLFGVGGKVVWFWGTLLLPVTMIVGMVAIRRRREIGASPGRSESMT